MTDWNDIIDWNDEWTPPSTLRVIATVLIFLVLGIAVVLGMYS